MAADLLLGIDSSTTACKAIVWDTRGRSLAEGRAPLPLEMPRPAWHEQPADAWWEACVQAIRTAVAYVDASRIAALGITAQRETFVPVDATGTPLRPAIVWMDERARDLLPTIAREYGAERIHCESGKPLSGNLTLGKIAWLRAYEPETFAHTARYLDVAAFLIHRLTGHYRTGWGCADPTGLFDMRAHRWNADLLAYLGVSVVQMPEAYPPGTVMGVVTAEAAALTGLPAGLPVVAGVGDGQAGGLGVGITEPGRAYLNLGTAVVSGTYADTCITDRAFRTMYGAVPGTYSLETVLLGGTYTISWFVEHIAGAGTWSDPQTAAPLYDEASAAIPPGAAGLILVPYWNSAMNPYWDAAASGIVVGWRGIHTRAHLYRAILEGIAFEQRLHTEGVEAALGRPVSSYVTMGGGSQSIRWRQIIADVTGRPVYRATTTEAAALGAAILAALGVGLFADAHTAAAAMTSVEPEPLTPDPARHKFYSQLYTEVYRPLFPAVQPYLQRLTALSETRL
ncbi:MAG: FGGY family carbohydrate kinase [Anaerolineae bacterium]|nr:FGGY family carbohydrate kinase [Anaerolineae bacterium]